MLNTICGCVPLASVIVDTLWMTYWNVEAPGIPAASLIVTVVGVAVAVGVVVGGTNVVL
jgi:hypothetical protein